MKKNLVLTVVVVFAFMAMANFALAGPSCGGDKAKTSSVGCAKTCAVPCGTKADAKDKTDGSLIKATADCDYKGKCETASLNISSMTCGGCESSITTALMKQEGVIKVVSIDHKSGQATVCFDSTKVESANLAKLVTSKGYKAEVMAALATDEATIAHTKACGMKTAKVEETTKSDY